MRLDRPYISVLSQHTRRVFIDLRCRLRGARADARAPRSGPCIEYSSPQGQARPALCAPRAPKSGPGRKTSEAISPRASLTQRAARGDLPPSRPGRCLDRGRGSGVWYRRGCLTGSRAGRPQHCWVNDHYPAWRPASASPRWIPTTACHRPAHSARRPVRVLDAFHAVQLGFAAVGGSAAVFNASAPATAAARATRSTASADCCADANIPELIQRATIIDSWRALLAYTPPEESPTDLPKPSISNNYRLRLPLHGGVDWDTIQTTPLRGRLPRSVAKSLPTVSRSAVGITARQIAKITRQLRMLREVTAGEGASTRRRGYLS